MKPIMEIIDEVPQEQINFWERHYISLYKSWGFELKNGTQGGEGSYKPTLETRIKMRNAKLGRKQSIETILKRSKSMIGNKNGLGYKKTEEQILNSKNNKKKTYHTEETKKKMSATKKGIPLTEAHKQALRGKRK